MEQALRFGGLVSLLTSKNLFRRFSTLPCKGLVDDSNNSRIGIVFAADDSTASVMETLQDVIRNTETAPPLGQRFFLARDLATTLHHLHFTRSSASINQPGAITSSASPLLGGRLLINRAWKVQFRKQEWARRTSSLSSRGYRGQYR